MSRERRHRQTATNSDSREIAALLRRTLHDLERASESIALVEFRLENGNTPHNHQGGSSKDTERILRRIVRPVQVLTMSPERDGGSRIALDDDPPRRLPPKLTALLLFLMQTALDQDELPGYRTLDETVSALELTNRHALSNLVSRMRKSLLEDHQRNPFLIEVQQDRLRLLARRLVLI